MLFFDEIKESEGLHAPEDTDFICTDMVPSNQCDFCHLYFFKNWNFNYQPHVCIRCHDASLHAQSLADLKISTIKSGVYRVC